MATSFDGRRGTHSNPLILARMRTVRYVMASKICPILFAISDWLRDVVTSRVRSSSARPGTILRVMSTIQYPSEVDMASTLTVPPMTLSKSNQNSA